MKILILGASGYLGGKVYEKLSSKTNMEVLGTCFTSQKNRGLTTVNINDEAEAKNLFSKFNPDVVICCLLSMNNERELTDKGLQLVVKNIKTSTKLIYISTDGFAEGQGNYLEDTALRHFSLSNPVSGYVNAKIDGENRVKTHGNSIVIRTGPLYGKDIYGNWDKRIDNLLSSLAQNQTVFRSSNLYKTFVHVDDLADLICEMTEKHYNGIIHAGPEMKESYYTFNMKIAKQLNLNEGLILAEEIDPVVAKSKGMPLDTSMNTAHCRKTFNTCFRNV